ncbi:glycosyltransferase [Halorubrum sp. SS5]|nr:glycosyltransferase [Halorubrum sp. SS5]
MSDITVVIPTLKQSRDEIPTIESIPEGIPVNIQRESPISRARNRGVERADTKYIIQLDDDIRFDRELWDELVNTIDRHRVMGMADWDYNLIVTRMIGFHRDVWNEIGGFDERLGSHMEDTDFAIKAEKHGCELIPIEQGRIKHVPHENRISTFDRTWRLVYLCAKHPRYADRLLRGTLL